jgi:hypothetical protein
MKRERGRPRRAAIERARKLLCYLLSYNSRMADLARGGVVAAGHHSRSRLAQQEGKEKHHAGKVDRAGQGGRVRVGQSQPAVPAVAASLPPTPRDQTSPS